MFNQDEARYTHRSYEVVEEHKAESQWQTCMCRSCQDYREGLKHPVGTKIRHKDESY